jgi:hypothetical protein
MAPMRFRSLASALWDHDADDVSLSIAVPPTVAKPVVKTILKIVAKRVGKSVRSPGLEAAVKPATVPPAASECQLQALKAENATLKDEMARLEDELARLKDELARERAMVQDQDAIHLVAWNSVFLISSAQTAGEHFNKCKNLTNTFLFTAAEAYQNRTGAYCLVLGKHAFVRQKRLPETGADLIAESAESEASCATELGADLNAESAESATYGIQNPYVPMPSNWEEQLRAINMDINVLPCTTTRCQALFNHCLARVARIRRRTGGTQLCVFKIGITACPEIRWQSYVSNGYSCFQIVHASFELGLIEMLELLLIHHFSELEPVKTLRNSRAGGEGMRDREGYPLRPGPYLLYVAAARADQRQAIRL